MPKKSTPKNQSKKARHVKIQQASVELKPNELTIRFDHPYQILPKLLELAGHFSDSHLALLSQHGAAAEDILGGGNARVIVSNCAQSTAWTATLDDLGLNPLIFRNCVASGVVAAGYIPPDDIPASPDTELTDVVFAIQGATHK